MKTYEKTYNLFARYKDKPFIGKYNRGEYFNPVFPRVAEDAWKYTEKIDGMNMRVLIDEHGNVQVRGRSNKAQIPGDLNDNILAMVANRMDSLVGLAQNRGMVTLYGEGYGPGIQKGEGYRDTKGFILFDICMSDITGEDGYFLAPDDVTAVAKSAKLTQVPHLFKGRSLGFVIQAVREGFMSEIGDREAEGIIAHAPDLFYYYSNSMRRVKFKLKTNDFPVIGKENG
jgi:hypothetical protein